MPNSSPSCENSRAKLTAERSIPKHAAQPWRNLPTCCRNRRVTSCYIASRRSSVSIQPQSPVKEEEEKEEEDEDEDEDEEETKKETANKEMAGQAMTEDTALKAGGDGMAMAARMWVEQMWVQRLRLRGICRQRAGLFLTQRTTQQTLNHNPKVSP
jgi:hypothetical protein